MIAEDNRTLHALMAMCLQDPCDLTLASKGTECWPLMQHSPPDALITDIVMPGDLDGGGSGGAGVLLALAIPWSL